MWKSDPTTGPGGAVAARLTFEEFFRAEYPSMTRALILVTGDGPTAEDLAQEAFARVYERWDRVGAMPSPGGYVYRTALNLNRKRLRRLGVERRHRSPAPVETDPATRVEARAELAEVFDSLPLEQREALMLVTWLGLDAEEAGRVLGIAGASVRGRIHRARESLRGRMGNVDA